MSLVFEIIRGGKQVYPDVAPAPRDAYAVPGIPSHLRGQQNVPHLNVIEWDHMNLSYFYPAALFSTWTVRTALYPLAVLKSRLQLQKQNTVYRSTLHAYTEISKQEGFRGLYRGFWVTVPQIGCSFIYSTIYEKLRAVLSERGNSSVAGISAIAGGAASFASQAIFVPTDIIAQYMMIYQKADRLVSGSDKAVIDYVKRTESTGSGLSIRVLKGIYKSDGIAGFYRGFWASTLVYVPSCVVMWPTYYWVQDVLNKLHDPTAGSLLFDQAVAATIGGACSTIATNPAELFRIRLQVHRTTYKETMSKLMRDEGWTILVKGLPPRLLSNSIYSCVVMVGYEIVKRLCVKEEFKEKIKW